LSFLYVGKNKFGLINFEKISPNPRVYTCQQGVSSIQLHKRYIHKKATRGSAGVGAFVKKELLNTFDVKIIDEDIKGILWLEFAAKFSKYHFYVVVCYLPLADTCRPVDSEIFFQSLLNQIYSYYIYNLPQIFQKSKYI
jgi:hypothetical protein